MFSHCLRKIGLSLTSRSRKRLIVKVGSSTSPALASARASSTCPSWLRAAARRIWAAGEFGLAPTDWLTTRVGTQVGALAHKVRQIEAIARLVDQEGCFRRALVGYFAGPNSTPRRSFSTWLLEWVFADRGRVQEKVPCCDACCGRMIKRRGQLGFVQDVLASGSS